MPFFGSAPPFLGLGWLSCLGVCAGEAVASKYICKEIINKRAEVGAKVILPTIGEVNDPCPNLKQVSPCPEVEKQLSAYLQCPA